MLYFQNYIPFLFIHTAFICAISYKVMNEYQNSVSHSGKSRNNSLSLDLS